MFVIAGLSRELAAKLTTEILVSQAAKLLPPPCRLVPFDVLSRALASRVPPRLHVAVPRYVEKGVPEERPVRRWYVGEWMCAVCGAPITRLPFEPDPDRLMFLSCRDCHRDRIVRGVRAAMGRLSSVAAHDKSDS